MIDDHLYSFLSTHSSITSIVSTRIYPEILPASPVYPSITYRTESHDIAETFAGNTNFVRSEYYIDAWAKTHNAARTLSDTIRSVLRNRSGQFGGIIVQRIVVSSGPVSVYEDSVEAYRTTQLFIIWNSEE